MALPYSSRTSKGQFQEFLEVSRAFCAFVPTLRNFSFSGSRWKMPLLTFSGRRGSSTNIPGWWRSQTMPGFGNTSVSSSKPSISKSSTFPACVSVSTWLGGSLGLQEEAVGQARQLSMALSQLLPCQVVSWLGAAAFVPGRMVGWSGGSRLQAQHMSRAIMFDWSCHPPKRNGRKPILFSGIWFYTLDIEEIPFFCFGSQEAQN